MVLPVSKYAVLLTCHGVLQLVAAPEGDGERIPAAMMATQIPNVSSALIERFMRGPLD